MNSKLHQPMGGHAWGFSRGNGALLPTTSVDQLGATLAKWFGISDADALTVFPHLANFTTRDLGFMNAG